MNYNFNLFTFVEPIALGSWCMIIKYMLQSGIKNPYLKQPLLSTVLWTVMVWIFNLYIYKNNKDGFDHISGYLLAHAFKYNYIVRGLEYLF